MIRRTRDNRAERLTDDEKRAVIVRAGPHRTVEFYFERGTGMERGRLICTRARIYAP